MAKQAKARGWRAGFGPNEVIQRVRPVESFKYLGNPHKGTTTFQRFNGDELNPGLSWNDREGPMTFKKFNGKLKNPRYPHTTMSYCRWVWGDLETQPGHFRWDVIDGALAAAEQRGQTLQLRIQPYIGDDLPRWYWDLGARKMAKPAGDTRIEPDHNDPAYLKYFGKVIRDFGKRYDGHPVLESFDIAYGGACGEVGGNCTEKTAEQLADVYLDNFKKTQLLAMLGTHGGTYAVDQRPTVGWRSDCYGDMRTDGRGQVPTNKNWNHMLDLYPSELFTCHVKDRWKVAPVTLETCWTVGHWQKEGWDLDFILEQGLKYHLSVFMPKSSYWPEEWMEKLEKWNRRLGYRFVLRQALLPLEAKPGQKFDYQMFVDNVGVAPIYRDYKLAWRFRQGDDEAIVLSRQDIRTWLPEINWFKGELVFPRQMKKGEVKVDIGIVDGKSLKPRVKFAIEGVDKDGWHPLTSMDCV
ncbi:MAG TPA: DUF4832 domain-containing protein [Planctomycetota bacterium]|nr:DUF4832 domain-containing protein [Planctomycetota bacterium]